MANILENSFKFFYSNYTGFYGKEKEKRCDAISSNSPVNLIIISVLGFIIIIVIGYYVVKINNLETFYLERLINFNSNNFDEYLKRLDELKKKFREDNNEEEDKNGDEGENKDDVELNDDNNSAKKEAKQNLENLKNMNKNSKKKKNKQNKLLQKRLEKKKIMSKYFYKINCFFLVKFCIIILISMIYFIVSLIVTYQLKKNFYEFDNIIEQINKIYYDSFDIFLTIKKGIEDFTYKNNFSKSIELPKDSDIKKPKFGNVLMNIMNRNRYSNDTLQKFSSLYNGEACNLISSDNSEKKLCESIFSSILKRGIEQAIVQMGIVITSCLDELNSIKDEESMKKVFNESVSFQSYEAFMSKFLLNAFWETHKIIDIFRNDEKNYIFEINNILLIAFFVLYMILSAILIYFIYSYVYTLNSFLNFIGILPSKFIIDDDVLYQNIIRLQEFY